MLRDETGGIGDDSFYASEETTAAGLPLRRLPVVSHDEQNPKWPEFCEYWQDRAKRRIYFGPSKIFKPEGVVRCTNSPLIKTYSGCIHEHTAPMHNCMTHAEKVAIAISDKVLQCGSCLLMVAEEHRHQCDIVIWKQVDRNGRTADIPV